MDSGKDEFQYRGKILFFETLKSEITINMLVKITDHDICWNNTYVHFVLQNTFFCS